MMPDFSLVVLPAFGAGWAYAILCLQVARGWPGFYAIGDTTDDEASYRERHLDYSIRNIFWMFLSMALLLLSAEFENLILFSAMILAAILCPVWFGVRQRHFLKEDPDLKYPSETMILFRIPILRELTNRYPMLVFDIWTIGIASLFFFILVLV